MTQQLLQNAAPAVIQHPDVDLQIDYYDCNPAEMPVKVMVDSYETHRVIVFKNAHLDMDAEDWRLLNGIEVPNTTDKLVKKAKLKHLFKAIEAATWKDHVLSRLTPSIGDAKQLQKLMVRVTQQVRTYVRTWFPMYEVVDDQSITWRLTQTESEPMHYDSYGVDPNDHHNVRVFINLDTKPRVWGLSRKVQDMIKIYSELMLPEKNQHPNLFTAALTKKLPWDKIPRTFVSFAPLNMWLVNSQVVAHEIIYGRRMLAATIACKPSSMVHKDLHFVDVVRNAWR